MRAESGQMLPLCRLYLRHGGPRRWFFATSGGCACSAPPPRGAGAARPALQPLQTLPAAYFDRTRTGDLMAHATNDIQQIRMATGMGLVALNDAVVMGLPRIAFMAYIDPALTGVVLSRCR